MKVLITGANGQLGRELAKTAPASEGLIALTRQELDICRHKKVEETVSHFRPHIIVNTAAYTAVDKAEEERKRAFAVNAEAAGNLAETALKYNARFIHISTDFVFDGFQSHPYKPGDPPNPLGVYGKSKLEGEHKVLEATKSQGLIVRTSWLYSVYGNNFLKTILRLIEKKDPLRIVDDQIGTPTWARGLAKIIWKFIEKPELKGIYHWSDAGAASWYDFAVAIQEEANRLKIISKTIPMIPIDSSKYPQKAPRPPYSILNKSKTQKDLEITPKHWQTALKMCLKEFSPPPT